MNTSISILPNRQEFSEAWSAKQMSLEFLHRCVGYWQSPQFNREAVPDPLTQTAMSCLPALFLAT